MNWELYAAFILASALLATVPGPNVALIIATSLQRGTKSGFLVVLGTSTAQSIQLSLAVLGLTTVALILAGIFEWLRWAGVAYLLYLAWRSWRAKPVGGPSDDVRHKHFFAQGFTIALFNPKTLLFHGAFLPQFIDPSLGIVMQSVVLGVTFLCVVTLIDGGYAVLAGWARGRAMKFRVRQIGSKIVAGIYGLAAIGLAAARR